MIHERISFHALSIIYFKATNLLMEDIEIAGFMH